MKIVIYTLICLSIIIWLIGCQSNHEKQVESVTKSFAEAFYNFNFEKAFQLSTEQSKNSITFFSSNIKENHLEVMRNFGEAKVEPIEITIGEYGITAKVKCKITNCMKLNFLEDTIYMEKEKEEVFHLIKSGKDWFVNFKYE